MKELELPEPAAALWLRARDVLYSLEPGNPDWTPYLSGGTVLAARWGHRKSTDIDIVLRARVDLTPLLKGPGNLAERLNAKVRSAWKGQIKLDCGEGEIDLSTAPVAPASGHERVRIAGRPQQVLSTAQILRGKFNRSLTTSPVRDAYDTCRCAQDPTEAGGLAAAYGLLNDRDQTAIETMHGRSNERYRKQAETELVLTEEPVVDMAGIGTAAAETLNGHRLERIVIELHRDRATTERTTRNGSKFKEECSINGVKGLYRRNGVEELLEEKGVRTKKLVERMWLHRADNRNGVLFDTMDRRPLDRITGVNRSMRRADAATSIGSTSPTGSEVVIRGPRNNRN